MWSKIPDSEKPSKEKKMTLQEALDECSICGLFAKNVSDEHKLQVIDKIISTSSTKVPKVKLSNIITWLLKKVEWQKQQIEKMRCCENCNNFQHRIDHRCNTKCKNLSEWEIKENE